MNKINGYTKEEANTFIKYICAGKCKGKTLSKMFEEYAQKSGRAKGSVRNYYYQLLRLSDNAEVKKILAGTNLKAENIRPFTDEETDKILKTILEEKSRGVSVRRAVLNLAGGDDKLMLRYQNKYRNVLIRQPERLDKIMKECGLDDEKRTLEDKINNLYEELASGLKQENKRLTDIIRKLSDENRLLKLQVKNLQS